MNMLHQFMDDLEGHDYRWRHKFDALIEFGDSANEPCTIRWLGLSGKIIRQEFSSDGQTYSRNETWDENSVVPFHRLILELELSEADSDD